MKKPIKTLGRQLGFAAALLFASFPTYSQTPTWPANPAVIGDYYDPGGVTALHANKHINMDMFGYWHAAATSLNPSNHLIAYAFDDTPAGSSISEVRLVLWDVGSSSFVIGASIPGAHQPDVVLLDHPNATNTGKDFYAALVYELNSNIYLQYYEISGVGTGSLTVIANTFGPTKLNNGINQSDNPHIDAAPHVTATVPLPSAVATIMTSPVYAFYNFAVTWHENNGGTQEIWTAVDNNFQGNYASAAPAVTKQLLDIGLRSDIALTRVHDINTNTDYYNTYYVIDKGGAIHNADIQDAYGAWGLPVVNTMYPPLESGAVKSAPRIDAGNVQDLNVSSTVIWQAVAALEEPGNPLHEEIHSYSCTGSLIAPPFNWSDPSYFSGNPLASWNAFAPAVATASNYPPYTAGAAFAGNTDYLMGFFLDDPTPGNRDYFEAVAQFGMGALSVTRGYDEVNFTAVNSATINNATIGNYPALALSYGTNTGYASTAAFFNGHDVMVKKPHDYIGSSSLFKPTGVTRLHIPNGLAVYPNPATNWIGLSGLEGESSYTIIDMLGKQYTQGSMGKSIHTIDISAYPAGTYMVTVNHNNQVKHLKFVKE